MAISPRSFLLNPALLLATLILGTLPILVVTMAPFPLESLSFWQAVRYDCDTVPGHPESWTEAAWEHHVECFLDQKRYPEAYAAADEGLTWFPNSASLLNSKGYAAARAQAFGIAALDFKTGLQRTGSPSGVFENNLAWVGLWQLESLPPERRGEALSVARSYYRKSLAKRTTCASLHTAMFVEFAAATHYPRSTVAFRRATATYDVLREAYLPCRERLDPAREEVVEEVMSAALMHSAMQRMRGTQPADATEWWDRAVRAGASQTMCAHAVPVASTRAECTQRLGPHVARGSQWPGLE